MKDEENKMQSAAPEQQAQPEQTQPESEPAADAAQPGTENEPKAETTAPETPDKKKRPLWLKLLAVFAAALAVLGSGSGVHHTAHISKADDFRYTAVELLFCDKSSFS